MLIWVSYEGKSVFGVSFNRARRLRKHLPFEYLGISIARERIWLVQVLEVGKCSVGFKE